MENRDAEIALARERHAAGDSVETQLARMRAAGWGKIDCIVVISDVLSIAKSEAKQIVHNSTAWADRRDSDDALHADAEAALERLQRRHE